VIGTVEFGKSSPLFRTRVEARRQHQGRHPVVLGELGLGIGHGLLRLRLAEGHAAAPTLEICGGSAVGMARPNVSIRPVTAIASLGVTRPSATARSTAATAFATSAALAIGGSSNAMGRSLRGGTRRSMQRRSAVVSPASASAMAFRVRASASPSSKDSAAIVERLRAPFGRPAGLPD